MKGDGRNNGWRGEGVRGEIEMEERRSGMRRRARNKTHDEASLIVIGSTSL